MAAEANPPDALRVHFVLYVSGASNAEFAEQFLNPVFHGAAFPSASAALIVAMRPSVLSMT